MEEKKETKNLRQKLQEARMVIKGAKLTKSGKNSFLGSSYYTLSDIQTPITNACSKVGICPVITFTHEEAKMTIYDFDSDETLVFTSPMVEMKVNDKKSMIQELGGQETYQRRFMYLSVFEIVEDDEEERTDDIERHDILMVKTRIEREMTQLLKAGYDYEDIIKKIGLKSSTQYTQYLECCNVINKIENNMRVMLNDKSKE